MPAYYNWHPGTWNDLKKIILPGMDNYPETPTAVYVILCHYKNPVPKCQAHTPTGAVEFSQSYNSVSIKTAPGNCGRLFAYFMCYRCQDMVNYAVNFPLSTYNSHVGSQSLQVGLTMTQTNFDTPATDIINTNCILLET